MAEETVGDCVWSAIFLCVSKPNFPGWFLDETSMAACCCSPLACCKVTDLFSVAVGMPGGWGCLVEVAEGMKGKVNLTMHAWFLEVPTASLLQALKKAEVH